MRARERILLVSLLLGVGCGGSVETPPRADGPTDFPLTVTRSGTGGGTVSSQPDGIDCGSACSARLPSGTSVTLTAAAAGGSSFAGWDGACIGTATRCTVSMTAARSVTATFDASVTPTTAPTTYPLTVTKAGAGGGTVTSSPDGLACGSTCSAPFAGGTSVTLTAEAAADSTFAGWGGSCSGTATTCTVPMSAARSVAATFDPRAGATTVAINAGGSAAGSFVADDFFSGGSTFSTLDPVDTSQLAGAAPPEAVLQSERYGEFTYTIPGLGAGSAQTVTLYFVESYVTAAGARTFDVSLGGTPVLTGFDIFAAAGGADRAISRTFETRADADGQVVIRFASGGGLQNPKVNGLTITAGGGGGTSHALTVTRSGTGSGTVRSSAGGLDCGSTCSATFGEGTSVTLSAAAASDSTFAGWGGACSGTAATCTVSMTTARSVTATFDAGAAPYAPCPASGPCRILPLGDSITDGFNIPGGYRIELFKKASAAGHDITFVGSGTNGPATIDGVQFPQRHEGHSGWNIDQIAGLVPSPALQTTPHIVLLMAGTNDRGYISGAPQRLDALLGKLFTGCPDALVVVAQVTPLSGGYASDDAAVRTYNAALPAIVDARVAQGKHVMLVDMYTGFPTTELADGIHPNAAGYARMAGVWYAAIGSRLR